MDRELIAPAERAATTPPVARPATRRLADGFRTPLSHVLAERAIFILAGAAILAIALIFVFIAKEALPLFFDPDVRRELDLGSLFFAKTWRGYETPVFVWQPVGSPAKYNIVPLFIGTLKVTVLAMAVSIPVGIGAAIFVSQYAPKRLREIIKPIIELLAGVPSVVLGFFALMIIATFVREAFGLVYRLNAIVAAAGLAIAIVPVIFTVSEDALRAVPRALSDAALALGARKAQIIVRVILPSALPGIAAAIILGFGRAIGETMIVLMASGNAAVLALFDPTTSVRTVTATIAAELGEVPRGDPHWHVLFFLGAMLFVVTFLLNLLGAAAVRRLEKRLTAS